jgi:putative flavoprotein involved in K+ transport
MNIAYDAVLIGAGPAGLAMGYRLQQAGLRFVILEAGDEPVGSWPHYYDSLSLNSSARYSSLPGLAFPGQPDHYPTRDEVVAYLQAYAAHFGLPVITGARVSKVERAGRYLRVTTTRQGTFMARSVVAATGSFGRPYVPDLPGRSRYHGRVLHVADYRRPEAFRDQRVVVVGGANAAVQIGVELARVARVTLATRNPIRFLPQRFLGQDIHFWLRLTHLDPTLWSADRSTPVFDLGRYRAAIAGGRPDRRPVFKSFSEEGVVWSDGRRERVDSVIFATGYRPYLPYLAGLDALDEAGRVLQRDGVSTSVPGLYYIGLARQRNYASAILRGLVVDSKYVVAHLRNYCQLQHRANGRVAPDVIRARQGHAWVLRGRELVGLINLIAVAFRQRSGGEASSLPRLVGEALVRSLMVSAGFLGVGSAATLYSQT